MCVRGRVSERGELSVGACVGEGAWFEIHDDRASTNLVKPKTLTYYLINKKAYIYQLYLTFNEQLNY